jgi:hypothetical protein
MDTMSMHTSVSGITSFQRALKMTMQSRSKRDLPLSRSIEENLHSSFEWNELSSLNNLADVYKVRVTRGSIDFCNAVFFVTAMDNLLLITSVLCDVSCILAEKS